MWPCWRTKLQVGRGAGRVCLFHFFNHGSTSVWNQRGTIIYCSCTYDRGTV